MGDYIEAPPNIHNEYGVAELRTLFSLPVKE